MAITFAHLERSYVEAGGTLIAEACPGRWDKYGWATLTQLVDGGEALFGAKHLELTMVKEPGGAPRWMPQERRFGEFDPPTVLGGVGEFAGLELRANFYLQRLEPTTGEAILKRGDEVVGGDESRGRGQGCSAGNFRRLQRAGLS